MAVARALVVMEVAVGPGEAKVAEATATPPRSPVRVKEAREILGAVNPSLRPRDPAV